MCRALSAELSTWFVQEEQPEASEGAWWGGVQCDLGALRPVCQTHWASQAKMNPGSIFIGSVSSDRSPYLSLGLTCLIKGVIAIFFIGLWGGMRLSVWKAWGKPRLSLSELGGFSGPGPWQSSWPHTTNQHPGHSCLGPWEPHIVGSRGLGTASQGSG